MTKFEAVKALGWLVVAAVLWIKICRRPIDGPVTRRDLRDAIALAVCFLMLATDQALR